MQKLEALLFCIQDLNCIEKEIEKINSRLEVGKIEAKQPKKVVTEKESPSPKKRSGKWFKKESSKHPGRFYYVNAETGESSWKRPADLAEAAVKPLPVAFTPPPGLCLAAPMPKNVRAPSPSSPSLPMLPEDAEMCFDDLKDLPVAVC